jgi:hypothetical protein
VVAFVQFVERVMSSDLIARARLVVATPPQTRTLVAAPPRPERVTIKVRCVTFNEDFPLVVERCGTGLRPVEESSCRMTEAEARNFTREISGPWRCPICKGRARGFASPLRGRLHGK